MPIVPTSLCSNTDSVTSRLAKSPSAHDYTFGRNPTSFLLPDASGGQMSPPSPCLAESCQRAQACVFGVQSAFKTLQSGKARDGQGGRARRAAGLAAAWHRQKPREALLRLALRFSAALRLAVPCCAAFESPRSGSAPQAFAALGATRMLPAPPLGVGGWSR